MEERVFVISKDSAEQMNKNFHACPVCRLSFKEGNEIILCPIQKASVDCSKKFVTVQSIPVHVKCYYVGD